MRRVAILLALVTSSGCVSSRFMKEIERPKLVPDASAATVVFVRPSSTASDTLVTLVDETGRFLGDSLPSSCFSTRVGPGDRVFVGWAANTAALDAELEAGKIYLVEVVIRFGALSPRANLFGHGVAKEDVARTNGWLADCTFYAVDERGGQAWLDEQEREVADRIRRGQELVARRRASEAPGAPAEAPLEEGRKRSLRGGDGRTE